jgi:hypothetical protein
MVSMPDCIAFSLPLRRAPLYNVQLCDRLRSPSDATRIDAQRIDAIFPVA